VPRPASIGDPGGPARGHRRACRAGRVPAVLGRVGARRGARGRARAPGREASRTPAATLINPDHETGLTSVALSADGKTVAASDDSGRTYLWDANTATRTHVLKPPDGSDVTCSAFSFFGGSLLVTGNRDGRAYLWDSTTGTLLRRVRDPGGSVDAVAIGKVGQLLATAGTGNAIHFWNVATGAPLGTISDPGGSGVRSLAFNLMGTQLAVADKNGATYVWNLAD
jgi:WD40 repeat protein